MRELAEHDRLAGGAALVELLEGRGDERRRVAGATWAADDGDD